MTLRELLSLNLFLQLSVLRDELELANQDFMVQQ